MKSATAPIDPPLELNNHVNTIEPRTTRSVQRPSSTAGARRAESRRCLARSEPSTSGTSRVPLNPSSSRASRSGTSIQCRRPDPPATSRQSSRSRVRGRLETLRAQGRETRRSAATVGSPRRQRSRVPAFRPARATRETSSVRAAPSGAPRHPASRPAQLSSPDDCSNDPRLFGSVRAAADRVIAAGATTRTWCRSATSYSGMN